MDVWFKTEEDERPPAASTHPLDLVKARLRNSQLLPSVACSTSLLGLASVRHYSLRPHGRESGYLTSSLLPGGRAEAFTQACTSRTSTDMVQHSAVLVERDRWPASGSVH